jgi:hypothetical protein
MSKITPKNLSYDSTLPPFLARLQSAPQERNEFQAARPKKQRTAEDEAEDEPVYFDEGSGETLSRREWEERENAAEEAEKIGEEGEEGVKKGERKGEIKEGKEKVAAIGVGKKRKVGKIVGGDEEEEDINAASKEPTKAEGPKPEGQSKKADAAKSKGKTAKKGKKIKLSFGDED